MISTVNAAENEGGGGFPILLGSAAGSLIMCIVLLRRKKSYWGPLEIITAVLFVICVGTFVFKGPNESVKLGVLSESIVGIYLIVKTKKCPVCKYNLKGYLLFWLASIITTISAPEWSWANVGYSLSEIVITGLTIVPLLVQLRKDKKSQTKEAV
jgi:hypothetical protein